jgi:hypothetical protein
MRSQLILEFPCSARGALTTKLRTKSNCFFSFLLLNLQVPMDHPSIISVLLVLLCSNSRPTLHSGVRQWWRCPAGCNVTCALLRLGETQHRERVAVVQTPTDIGKLVAPYQDRWSPCLVSSWLVRSRAPPLSVAQLEAPGPPQLQSKTVQVRVSGYKKVMVWIKLLRPQSLPCSETSTIESAMTTISEFLHLEFSLG